MLYGRFNLEVENNKPNNLIKSRNWRDLWKVGGKLENRMKTVQTYQIVNCK